MARRFAQWRNRARGGLLFDGFLLDPVPLRHTAASLPSRLFIGPKAYRPNYADGMVIPVDQWRFRGESRRKDTRSEARCLDDVTIHLRLMARDKVVPEDLVWRDNLVGSERLDYAPGGLRHHNALPWVSVSLPST